MAEVLGLGVTHSPLLVGSEGKMAGTFERVLNSPRLPAAAREPANWPPQMQHEWTEHQAGRAASAHRHRAVEGFRAVRAALDAFNPDFILIWGDDQYENFREDGVAQFCVFARAAIDSSPFKRTGPANAWGEPADTGVHSVGHRSGGRGLAASLMEQGFEISYAYTMRHEAGLPHAFINAMLLLITTVKVCRGQSCRSMSTSTVLLRRIPSGRLNKRQAAVSDDAAKRLHSGLLTPSMHRSPVRAPSTIVAECESKYGLKRVSAVGRRQPRPPHLRHLGRAHLQQSRRLAHTAPFVQWERDYG